MPHLNLPTFSRTRIVEDRQAKTETAKPHITIIGGGSGSFNILSGLRSVRNCHSIVTMMDSGGDSGELRDAYGVLPPGDARRCLVALSAESKVLRDLFSVRFNGEPLEGRNFGNLFFLALRQCLGSDKEAFEAMGRILKVRGRVLPVTFDSVQVVAELENGEIVHGEAAIDRRGRSVDNSARSEPCSPIGRVYLEPSAASNCEARDSISTADAIVIAPGDVYSSIIPNLLVQGIPEAIAESGAPLVMLVNIMTKHGETDGWTAARHVEEISKYARRVPDAVVVNRTPVPQLYLDMYKAERADQVVSDPDAVKRLGVRFVVEADVMAADSVIRHDPSRTAQTLVRTLDMLQNAGA